MQQKNLTEWFLSNNLIIELYLQMTALSCLIIRWSWGQLLFLFFFFPNHVAKLQINAFFTPWRPSLLIVHPPSAFNHIYGKYNIVFWKTRRIALQQANRMFSNNINNTIRTKQSNEKIYACIYQENVLYETTLQYLIFFWKAI